MPDVAVSPPSAASTQPWPSSAQAWYLIAVLMVAYVLSFIDRVVLALLVGPIRAEWLDGAHGLGRQVRVETPAGLVEGVFEDLDLSGALILNSNGDRRVIAAGAVLPPAPRSP